MKALTIKALEISYGDKPVLSNLDLSLESGDILCLLGPSGCGKTTLLKAIAGLVPVAKGQIKIDDLLVNDDSKQVLPEHRNVGMIFQDYALFPHLSVFNNIAFGLKGQDKETIKQRVNELMALVKLNGLESRYPHQLSGGQQQRVAIARALARKPKLLLLDEPFSNIDTQVRHQLIDEIRSIIKAHGVSAIFVTHSRDEAFAFGDKLALFENTADSNSRIAQINKPEVLYDQPNSPFVAEFMGQVNYLKATIVDEYHVQTALGLIKSTTKLNAKQGECKQLLLRPQQITIATQGVPAQVVSSRFMGDNGFTRVNINDYDLVIAGHFYSKPIVNLVVDSHDLVLFDEANND